MILFLYASLASSVALQIDLGCESMRASMMQRGSPVSIVMNGLGRRYTPAVASILPISDQAPAIFTDQDVQYFKRSVGDISTVQRYPLNSTRFLPQILGKNYSSKLVSYFMRRNLTMPFDSDEDKYLDLIAPPEFFAAQLLQSAIADCKNSKINRTVDDLALVIPKFLTHHQRTAFIRASKLSTYTPRLVDTFSAVGTLFALERSQLFRNKPMYVCFIDIGASQMQVSIQEFTKAQNVEKGAQNNEKETIVNELGYAWTDLFGSYSVDCQIARAIRREIRKQKPDAVFDDKSVQRILHAARQVKHELTLQPKVSLFLEDLVHGFDMTFTYSMDQLKKRCRKELNALNTTFFTAFWKAGFDAPEDIDRFELVGGGTRSPLFIDAINATFNGKVPVLRSLNTEEAAVIGAGYVVASSRKNYLANNIRFNGVDAYDITINKTNDGRVASFYYKGDQKLPIGIKPFIRAVDLGQKGKYEIVDGRVRVHGCRKLTFSGLYKEKRTRVEKTLQAFEEIEAKQSEHDKLMHEFDTFLIETREKLTKDEFVMKASSVEERSNALRLIANYQYMIQKIQMGEECHKGGKNNDSEISGDLDSVNSENEVINGKFDESELKRMKNDIEEATKLIFKRASDLSDSPAAYQKLADLLESINQAVETDWPKMGLRPRSKHLKKLGRQCQKTEKWLDDHEESLEGVSLDDINIMYERLRQAFEIVKKNLKQSHQSSMDL
ncbi:dnaK protein [Tritrichomonas foetus]|uniref:DnaK protein n=1 Tax=Tritrichomonas foetus TaxID=1144522 RepID=A0A1J4JBH3_9EUKA|nr:dnaK protein [Tritrichomonas foetus]|eukprot:OHS94596.1 dnaK protein [Tritrichomonas foetus]